MYIAFAGGIPLRRFCSSVHDADEAIAAHERLSDLEKTKCEMTGVEAEPGLDGEPIVYSVVDGVGPYLILDQPDSMRRDSYVSLTEAVEASRLDPAAAFSLK